MMLPTFALSFVIPVLAPERIASIPTSSPPPHRRPLPDAGVVGGRGVVGVVLQGVKAEAKAKEREKERVPALLRGDLHHVEHPRTRSPFLADITRPDIVNGVTNAISVTNRVPRRLQPMKPADVSESSVSHLNVPTRIVNNPSQRTTTLPNTSLKENPTHLDKGLHALLGNEQTGENGLRGARADWVWYVCWLGRFHPPVH